MIGPPSTLLPEPLPLIESALAFLVQVLIARHPELLAPPEEPLVRAACAILAARQVVAVVEELHGALEDYRAALPISPRSPRTVDAEIDERP